MGRGEGGGERERERERKRGKEKERERERSRYTLDSHPIVPRIHEPTEDNSIPSALYVDMLAYATSKTYTPLGGKSAGKLRQLLGEAVEPEVVHELMEDEEGGVEPSNLVHVEIKSLADVRKLIAGVKVAVPSTSFLNFVEQVGIPIAPGKRTPNAHSVITISVQDAGGSVASAAAAAASAAATVGSFQSGERIVVDVQLTHDGQLARFPALQTSRIRIVTLGDSKEGEAPWSKQLDAAVACSSERKAPARFGELNRSARRSVVPLVLRDVLLRRVPSAFIACVSPGLTRAGPTSACLKGAARFRAACGLPLSEILDGSFAASTGASPFRGTVDSAEKVVATASPAAAAAAAAAAENTSVIEEGDGEVREAGAVSEDASPSPARHHRRASTADSEMPGVARSQSSPSVKGSTSKL